MPLTARKDIKDNEAKRDEFLKNINTATGQTYTLEVDMPSLYAVLKDDHKNRIGDTVYNGVFRSMSINLVKLCKDDMSKEAFVEATPSKKIMIKVAPGSGYYGKSKIEDGAWVLYVDDNKSGTNFQPTCNEEIGQDIGKIL